MPVSRGLWCLLLCGLAWNRVEADAEVKKIQVFETSKEVELPCRALFESQGQFQLSYWILNDRSQLDSKKLEISTKYRLPNPQDGRLQILDVAMKDAGMYTCVVELESNPAIAKTSRIDLKVIEERRETREGEDPANIDEAEKAMWGAIAAGSFAAAVMLICLVYKFRWKDPRTTNTKYGTGTAGLTSPGSATTYDNMALDIDSEGTKDTKGPVGGESSSNDPGYEKY
ncbi:unnamed protein product [Darwinula stevensoni]|uniref:Ig-like domain-containing protein n=1 Tax=Darwinula stevensoni TaxID=69355 RepID=A0A7R8XGU9_9CRUS|nr:unnamed protein product [Darwinula stevensoni]CAG0891832.1 unnamed protein product [Darwinula stevensoni]